MITSAALSLDMGSDGLPESGAMDNTENMIAARTSEEGKPISTPYRSTAMIVPKTEVL
jgi:hypothetical protein